MLSEIVQLGMATASIDIQYGVCVLAIKGIVTTRSMRSLEFRMLRNLSAFSVIMFDVSRATLIYDAKTQWGMTLGSKPIAILVNEFQQDQMLGLIRPCLMAGLVRRMFTDSVECGAWVQRLALQGNPLRRDVDLLLQVA